MDILQKSLHQLHPLELKVLVVLEKDRTFTAQQLVSELSMVLGQVNQAISWLLQKDIIVETHRSEAILYERTDLGEEWATAGSPAKRVYNCIVLNPCTLSDVESTTGIEKKDIGSAYGLLSKAQMLTMNENKVIELGTNKNFPEPLIMLETLLQDTEHAAPDLDAIQTQVIEQYAKKRGASNVPFRKIVRENIVYTVTDTGMAWANAAVSAGLTGEKINALTTQMLKNRSWQGKNFRAYNISLPPNRVPVGRRNPYADFLRQVKDKLIALGFEEFDGPLVETEFWNSDALFMPQFHAARDIHDVYYVKEPTHAKEIASPWLSNVADVHEHGGDSGSRGWQYPFDRSFTRRLLLRSQGTVMSAKTLPHAKVPGKYFGILRVFRHDQIDATHLSDFYQTEGIILGDDVNVKTLLGLLKIFAEEFAHAEEVKYVPGYFPFTEPSVEVHIKHPQIGWMELGGSGIFRPEVTRPLGIDVPVAAWGIGIDRMATMQMGINDLRDLFSYDIEQVSRRRGVII